MNKLATSMLAATALFAGGTATANEMYIDLGSNAYEVSPPNPVDADGTTGVFTEFSFNQILATSIYNVGEAGETGGTVITDVFGSFYDTNVASLLTANTIPTSGTAMDGVTTVTLVNPIAAVGSATSAQTDLDALSPLVPPFGSDSEGFALSWDLRAEYTFNGILTLAGPVYTGGTLNIYFNDFGVAGDVLAISANLTGSDISLANLFLDFDITFALEDWLYVKAGGAFVDANDVLDAGGTPTLRLNTNVNPPIPVPSQLLVVNGVLADGVTPATNAIRQALLNGGITAVVPAPATIAILGLGLLGLGASARRRKS